MFTITNTRIVGLIAVVCAAIAAPQALAMPIIDSQDDTSTIIAPPADGIQGNVLSHFDLSDLNFQTQQQQEYSNGFRRLRSRQPRPKRQGASHSQWRSPLGQPANNTPGGIVRTSKSGTAASTAAAIKALQRRSVALDAAYRKLYPGAYRQAAPKNSKATTFIDNPLGDLKSGRVVFTAATPDPGQGYDLSGLDLSVLNGIRGYEKQDQYLKGLALAALAGGTEKSVEASTFGYMPTNPGWGAAATAAKESAAALAVKTAPVVCLGQAEYDSVDLGCEWWS